MAQLIISLPIFVLKSIDALIDINGDANYRVFVAESNGRIAYYKKKFLADYANIADSILEFLSA